MSNIAATEAVPSLDYMEAAFTKPQYDSKASETKYEYYFPVNGVKNTTNLKWTIPRINGPFIQNIDKMVLAVDVHCTNAACQKIPEVGISAGPIQNFLFSMFGALRICYNTTCVLRLDHFPVYCYLRHMLNCDNQDISTWLETQCFYKEAESQDLDDVDTAGYTNRRNCFGGIVKSPKTINGKPNPELGKFKYSEGATFLIGTLPHFLPQPSYLGNVDIHIELEINKPSYCFLSADDTTANTDIAFDFERCRMYIPQTKLNEKLFLRIENRLAKEAMRQFYTSTQIDTYAISTGSKKANFDCIATGFSASRIFLLITETERLNGKFSLNPFKFGRVYNQHNSQPFMLDDVKVTLAGNEIEGLACDKSLSSFRDQYFRLMESTRQNNGKNACAITFKDFRNHALFLCYDLTASLNASEPPLLPLVRHGHLRV